MPPNAQYGLLRTAALIAAPVGALGSLGFMFQVGHRNESVFLLACFTLWVLSPFLGLARVCLLAPRWPVLAQRILYWVMLVVALGSLALYGSVAFGWSKFKPAFFFLVAPLVSWLLIALVASVARSDKTRNQRT